MTSLEQPLCKLKMCLEILKPLCFYIPKLFVLVEFHTPGSAAIWNFLFVMKRYPVILRTTKIIVCTDPTETTIGSPVYWTAYKQQAERPKELAGKLLSSKATCSLVATTSPSSLQVEPVLCLVAGSGLSWSRHISAKVSEGFSHKSVCPA